MARIINKEEKKCKIALSAIEFFCNKGIQQTSIDEIAKSAKIAKGTIYLYFKSKEEIVCTIWDIIKQRHRDAFQKRIKEGMSAKEKILEYYSISEHEAEQNKEQILKLYQHFISSMLIDETGLYTVHYESLFQQDYDFITSTLNEGVVRGELYVNDIDSLTNIILMFLKGILVRAKASKMSFDEAQKILIKHIAYLLDQCACLK